MLNVALAGNPNSGKTSLFNELTGAKQHVGNWPGVTVEQKTGILKKHKNVKLIDLPGIYSLSPYSPEEVVSRDYILKEHPEVVIDIVDATNLERNLYLTTQLLEAGAPVVLALNMMDLVRKRGLDINIKALSESLGNVPVVEISALERLGMQELTDEVLKSGAKHNHSLSPLRFDKEIETVLDYIIKEAGLSGASSRYYAIKLFENDERIVKEMAFESKVIENIRAKVKEVEQALGYDAVTLVINGRYGFIAEIMPRIMKRQEAHEKNNLSDKIDNIVTNRILALPIFALVIWAVYFVSIQTIGGWSQDWVGTGFEMLSEWTANWMTGAGIADWLVELIAVAVITGVGAVLTFVPQIMILYFFLSFLEGCGYMSRIAFIMDRIFRRFGLSGKSFIPFLMATGCGVPAIMASRTIEDEKNRRLTIMVTTFMPCGAKLPIIALFAGALFPGNSLIAPLAYFTGILSIFVSCVILKATKAFKSDAMPFIIELPEYRLPKATNLFLMMWEKARVFIYKAGTVIFACVVVIWFLSNYNFQFQAVEADRSMLAAVGNLLSPLFVPLGWGTWQATAGAFSGLVAKENLVGTLGVLYGKLAEADETSKPLIGHVANNFTPASGLSYMMFNLLCAPCFAAIGAIRREMMSAKWTIATIAYQTAFAYTVALLVYQIGRHFL